MNEESDAKRVLLQADTASHDDMNKTKWTPKILFRNHLIQLKCIVEQASSI
jgi:hypothetical protein